MSHPHPQSLIGTWRRFGAQGPAYQVVSIGGPIDGHSDCTIRIRLAESGEEIDYTLNRAVDDDVLVGAAG